MFDGYKSRLKPILKERELKVVDFSKISNIDQKTISFLNQGYYDKVSTYHLYKISSVLKISADFIVRTSDTSRNLKDSSIAHNINIHKFHRYFDIDMMIDELIELCKNMNISIDEMFMYEYV